VREPDSVVDACRGLQPAVYGALLLYCGERELAEDLTQETLARVWEHWSSVSTMEYPDRWALRVAFNLAKLSTMFPRSMPKV
jgi:DNA-directed RNA polymerase specialized sigma24 family protein